MKTSILTQFDAVVPFNSKYIKVTKGELYNLIDSEGSLLCNTWFANITETSNGEYNFVEQGSKQSICVPKTTNLARYATLRSTLANTPIWGNMDMSSITFLATPIIMNSHSERNSITIVAKSTMYGKTYLISDKGEIFNENGKRTSLPTFIIPQNYLNTCIDLTHKFNTLYCPNYKGAGEHTSESFDDLKKDCVGAFIFAFCDEKMTFNTSRKPHFLESPTKPWGGDTIKLRIYLPTIAEGKRGIVEHFCEDKYFVWWEKHNCYTHTYTLDEFHELVANLETLTELYYRVD